MLTLKFPVSTFQNAIKMTLESSQELRVNLRRSYITMDNWELNDCNNLNEFKKILFEFWFSIWLFKIEESLILLTENI